MLYVIFLSLFFFYTYMHAFVEYVNIQPCLLSRVLLPGKSRGQRSLEGCSPQGSEEADTTERLHFFFFFTCPGTPGGWRA